jgi:hypothetical protein
MNRKCRKTTGKLYPLLVLAVTSMASAASAQQFEAKVDEYGHPDFRGIWNFSSNTPLERPEWFGGREFLSEEEIQQTQERRRLSRIRSAEREATISQQIISTQNSRSVGAVNSFWMERNELRPNQRTSLIIYPENGRLPVLQDGLEIQHGDQSGIREIPGDRPVRYTHGGIGSDGPEDRGLSERCIVFNSGPPILSGPYNNNLQIFQNKDHVVILLEMGFDARIVPIDKNVHIDNNITQWSGDSRGYFEGNSLIVETRNFTNKIASLGLRDKAYGDAADRILIEKFTISGEQSLEYEFTIEDLSTFTDRIVVNMPMVRVEERLYEYACHAGNYAIGNILKGARQTEK